MIKNKSALDDDCKRNLTSTFLLLLDEFDKLGPDDQAQIRAAMIDYLDENVSHEVRKNARAIVQRLLFDE